MESFHDLKNDYFTHIPTSFGQSIQREVKHSDISAHLPVLEYYSSLCKHVTEFGVRQGYSTVALISGKPDVVHSYDIDRSPMVAKLESMVLPTKWVFHQGDTSNPELGVEETDFIYVDTMHTYDHVTKELTLWGRKARKFLGFHDTFTCGYVDESNTKQKGILPAINEFLEKYPGEYKTVYRTDFNNGCWILERIT